MGKKKKGDNLGKALIRDRFGPRRGSRKDGDSFLHTSELNDGYDWGRLNLQSVTEESSFQEFLSTAELAGTEFQAEKLDIKFITPQSGLLTDDEKQSILALQEKHKNLLKIPRRPSWGPSTTAEQQQNAEKESFLEWRRHLALLQESENLLLTPYEKNLEFWRQLWRVIERSDVLVQIVDARNPLLFRCPDLESYVTEVDPNKVNLILLNKADFLSEEQRQVWADYFTGEGIRVAFFSATQAAENIKEEDEQVDEEEDQDEQSSDDEIRSVASSISSYQSALGDIEDDVDDNNVTVLETNIPKIYLDQKQENAAKNELDGAESHVDNTEIQLDGAETQVYGAANEVVGSNNEIDDAVLQNSPELLSREGLLDLFKSIYVRKKTYTKSVTTIGMVGYPNVGKSSTVNALMRTKKTSVSATPGRTKHFQTLFPCSDILLCDCPGLVMPSFISTKAEMILNGILPIDQLRDQVPPMNLLGSLIPRHVLEQTYGFMISPPSDGEDPDRPPNSEEILNAYGYNRGFMTQNGQPDNPRSARYILKDFVSGRLLHCVAPPGVEQDSYHRFPARSRAPPRHVTPATLRATKGSCADKIDSVDRSFFQQTPGFHFKGRHAVPSTSSETSGDKPWKKINRHANKNKREKLRRVHGHLDLH